MQLISTAGLVDSKRTKPELAALSIPEIVFVWEIADCKPYLWRAKAIDGAGNLYLLIQYGRWSWGAFRLRAGQTEYDANPIRSTLKRALRKAIKS